MAKLWLMPESFILELWQLMVYLSALSHLL
jgi:hypothetical protein